MRVGKFKKPSNKMPKDIRKNVNSMFNIFNYDQALDGFVCRYYSPFLLLLNPKTLGLDACFPEVKKNENRDRKTKQRTGT